MAMTTISHRYDDHHDFVRRPAVRRRETQQIPPASGAPEHQIVRSGLAPPVTAGRVSQEIASQHWRLYGRVVHHLLTPDGPQPNPPVKIIPLLETMIQFVPPLRDESNSATNTATVVTASGSSSVYAMEFHAPWRRLRLLVNETRRRTKNADEACVQADTTGRAAPEGQLMFLPIFKKWTDPLVEPARMDRGGPKRSRPSGRTSSLHFSPSLVTAYVADARDSQFNEDFQETYFLGTTTECSRSLGQPAIDGRPSPSLQRFRQRVRFRGLVNV
ncbi:hypothetical protein BIW11_06861 [Tropilaelaps mercedesae]|uniref:Uncharacterized protein n=1 Tax=Tropilaelaps mercedesae TaxID=418985 RepID=A0A1V9XWA0_9ACAR|nr:hypothetical protein BIW11_06861 [Tropilaelaps mercedesae]